MSVEIKLKNKKELKELNELKELKELKDKTNIDKDKKKDINIADEVCNVDEINKLYQENY